MNYVYLAPAALVDGALIGAHQALACPADPTLRLVVVEHWVSDVAQDAFEAHPDVRPYYPWDSAKPVPVELVAAFDDEKQPARLTALDTLGSALWKIRASWPALRY